LEVGQGVDAAVTALQFQDMGSQLLGQMRKHHARLGAVARGRGARGGRWPSSARWRRSSRIRRRTPIAT
ncbi:methyl-accepting chemotaxis protein, partial [Pseudomonas aeruginosa]|nr:methyl-accepting chemotaxis protein [Pseudomonas aeruginosa]